MALPYGYGRWSTAHQEFKNGLFVDHAKRTFIGLDRTQISVDNVPLRPPWALTEALFLEACTGCGNCIAACPEKIIHKGSSNFPIVEFSHGECTFCQACVDSCADAAFRDVLNNPAWDHKALVRDSCLPKKGIACQSCQDVCDTRAISFSPRVGGPAEPEINQEACNGCGACFSVCPSNAITFAPSLNVEVPIEKQ